MIHVSNIIWVPWIEEIGDVGDFQHKKIKGLNVLCVSFFLKKMKFWFYILKNKFLLFQFNFWNFSLLYYFWVFFMIQFIFYNVTLFNKHD
jgi:hypothetical protein